MRRYGGSPLTPIVQDPPFWDAGFVPALLTGCPILHQIARRRLFLDVYRDIEVAPGAAYAPGRRFVSRGVGGKRRGYAL